VTGAELPPPVEVRKAGDRWEWICRRAGYDRDLGDEFLTWAEAFADGYEHSRTCNIPPTRPTIGIQ